MTASPPSCGRAGCGPAGHRPVLRRLMQGLDLGAPDPPLAAAGEVGRVVAEGVGDRGLDLEQALVVQDGDGEQRELREHRCVAVRGVDVDVAAVVLHVVVGNHARVCRDKPSLHLPRGDMRNRFVSLSA